MYYYNDGENEVGPFAISRLKTLHENGLIGDGTLVRQRDSRAWVPLRQLISEYGAAITPAAPEPSLASETVSKKTEPETEHNFQSGSDMGSDAQATTEEATETPFPQPNVNSVTDSVATTAPKAIAADTKSGQSYDPAYKYIPKEKRTSPEGKARSVPETQKAYDPAYKYIPKDKRISTAQETAVPSETNGPEGWLSYPPTPWRRYAARLLDTSLNGVLGFFLFAIAFYAIAPASADNLFSFFGSGAGLWLDLLATGIMASLIGGALIGVSGFTVGKLIFGIKVVRKNGNTIGFGAGIMRDLEVLIKGMALGIPIVALFTLWLSYKSLTENRTTSWDENRYVVYHRPSGAAQYFLNVLGLVAVVLVYGLLGALAEM